MKSNPIHRKKRPPAPAAPIRTNLLEIIDELSKLTDDDTLVVAAARSIIRSYKIKTVQSLVPMRLARDAGAETDQVMACPV